ncbi:hypothetical protein PAXRUDRAFT_833133 [Paxillus rubicundulus Ve08.2h10]|uniref:Uncharacterized protein n=1 Tax=Paxillus rubicundulus Ve08.2h10 TaxID=930991 RepID=A0A0D0DHS7_9AGAM|nr:hypothetical protein PAXRUDRAFT_833133 [Paxillus rubicundulus Ve08.2h10]
MMLLGYDSEFLRMPSVLPVRLRSLATRSLHRFHLKFLGSTGRFRRRTDHDADGIDTNDSSG